MIADNFLVPQPTRKRMSYYTPREMAEYFGVSVNLIYDYMHRDFFPSDKEGGRYYIHESVVAWIDRVGESIFRQNGMKRYYPLLVWKAFSKGEITRES